MQRQLDRARRVIQSAGFPRRPARKIAIDCRDASRCGMCYYWLDYRSEDEVRPGLSEQVRRIFGVERQPRTKPQPVPAQYHVQGAAMDRWAREPEHAG